MRKATYVIPHAAGEKDDGELGVFYFGPGQGGAVEANVDRWVNGLVTHTVEIESASFAAGAMGMTPKADAKLRSGYALLGAIVETPGGPYFFKLTGPKATVAGAKATFYKLLDSLRLPS